MASYADYKRLRGSLDSAIGLLDSASSKLMSTGNSLSEAAVIGGKTFDDEAIQNCINLLSQISSDFSSVSYHCTSRMNELLPVPNNNNGSNSNVVDKGKFEMVNMDDFG